MLKALTFFYLLVTNSAWACETPENLALARQLRIEINSIRTAPREYVSTARNRWATSTALRQSATALCKSQTTAQKEFNKALSLLAKQSPLKAYESHNELNQVACDIVSDMASKDLINPLYEDYESFFTKRLSIKSYKHSLSVSSGMTQAQDMVIRFLIGDCLFTGSHGESFKRDNIFWHNIFSQNFGQMGSACSKHPLTAFDGPKIMCASTFLKKGKTTRIKKGYQKGFEEL